MRFGNLTLNYCVQLLIHHPLLPLFLTPSGCGTDGHGKSGSGLGSSMDNVVGSGLWAVLFPCPVTYTARGMRSVRHTLTCFASFHEFRLLRACGFYIWLSLLIEKHNVNRWRGDQYVFILKNVKTVGCETLFWRNGTLLSLLPGYLANTLLKQDLGFAHCRVSSAALWPSPASSSS